MRQKPGLRKTFPIPTLPREGRKLAREAAFVAVLFAACTVLAGCHRAPPQSVAVQAPLEEVPIAYAYVCPPARQTQEQVEGVCVASFQPDDGPLSYPALALGPRDGLVAVAGSGAPLARVFVSTNGGVDWRPAGLPRELAPAGGPDQRVSTGRVALEFDGRGTLHLVAELYRGAPTDLTASFNLYYASTSDLGKSWTRPVMLPTNGGGVYPKLTVWADRIFVTWGYRGGHLHLAWSTDGGNSWSQAKGAPDDCINTSEVAVLRGKPYVACAGYMRQGDAQAALGRNPFTGLRLYRLDPSDELSLVASLDSFKGVWPRLFAAPGGSLVLAAKLYRLHSPPSKGWDKCCAAVARSVDGGRTWSEPVDLRRALRSEDNWDTFDLSDARLDAWGFLHFIASGSDQADPANGSPGTDARLVHAAFDPASGRLLGESSLTPPTDGPQGYYPGGASLAFNGTRGVVLWTYGKGLDYTRLNPKGATFSSAQETKQSPTESGQVDDSTHRAEREAMAARYRNFRSYVKGGSVQAHWMSDGSSFWYSEGAPDNTVIYKVDPKANTKVPLFDVARLRKALIPLLGHEPPFQGLPFDEFTFADLEKAVKFTVEKKTFILQFDTYTITAAPSIPDEEKKRWIPREVRKRNPLYEAGEILERLSPDQKWFASLSDYNLRLRSPNNDSLVQLTSDGVKNYELGSDFVWTEKEWAWWSPNSSRIAVKRIDYRNVEQIPIVNWLEAPPTVEWIGFDYPGGSFPSTELFIIDIRSGQRVRVETPPKSEDYLFVLGWRPDGSELLFFRIDREYKNWRLMAADGTTGATRLIFSETGETFVGQPTWVNRPGFQLLKDGRRFLWLSERDEWAHIYLYDIQGKLIRQLTKGTFPVVEIVTVDEDNGWVYFTAHGDPQRPYDTHLYRVTLEGKEFTRLSEATGQHFVDFSPSGKFYLDTHSSLDRPPVVELRKADGHILQILSKASIDALTALNWRPPEEFKAKAADGITDLYGVLYKPYDFDPDRKYPIIEQIYGGPYVTAVPRGFTWGAGNDLAQLGFIVFVVDERGTPERGKRFHDVDYRNMGRDVIPDHVAVLKQLAAERPYMDLSRVGITGGSAGGYYTVAALLRAPDVYHVGVAVAAPTDFRSLSAMGIEPYMGVPERNREGYEYASLLNLAHNLKGKLLLIHGTSDKNVPFSNTMKLADAFVRANKHFDLLLLPGQGHGFVGPSVKQRGEATYRYFQERLKP